MTPTDAPEIRMSMGDFAALMEGHERMDASLDRITVLAAASQKVVDAVRAWRDAGADPVVPPERRILWQAVVAAEWAMLNAISDYEAAVEGDPDGASVALAYIAEKESRSDDPD